MFQQRTVPRAAAPPAMIDHRLWLDRSRLDLALSGIYEVRELPDLTLAGFSSWQEGSRTVWCYVLFNRRNQLLSVQIVPEAELNDLMSKGVAIWTPSESAYESPAVKLKQASRDLLTLTTELVDPT